MLRKFMRIKHVNPFTFLTIDLMGLFSCPEGQTSQCCDRSLLAKEMANNNQSNVELSMVPRMATGFLYQLILFWLLKRLIVVSAYPKLQLPQSIRPL